MRLGDMVIDSSGFKGTIIAHIDAKEFSPEYPRDHWAYLSRGVMVKTEEAGLVHYEEVGDLTVVTSE